MQSTETSGATSAARSACAAEDNTAIRVSVRARPLVPRERLDGAKTCINVDESARSVVLGCQRQFSFDAVFDQHSSQDQVYETCVADLVTAVVEGYNATVLAYGPTGSGKTYTMGTGSALHCMEEQQGIIPRVIRQLFNVIQQSESNRSFTVKAQFLEIYNEELRDLLAPASIQTCINSAAATSSSTSTAFNAGSNSSGSGTGLQRSNVTIRECSDGQIVVTGAREEVATSYEDLVHLLDRGALSRATGATSLNEQSSRSHAIFTIIVEQSIQNQHHGPRQAEAPPVRVCGSCDGSNSTIRAGTCSDSHVELPLTPRMQLLQQMSQGSDSTTMANSRVVSNTDSCLSWSSSSSGNCLPGDVCGHNSGEELVVEYRCAKFHLVDLAGSERTKRSGAVGARLKETVTINQGLLALGNVICALGDDRRRWPGRHIPYRDSKLTRLLQDSLGGNSKTVMIACISSADDVMEETLNTLKYASRARSIRNKPVINWRKVIGGTSGAAADVQALQLLLLRRFIHQMLGPVSSCIIPEVLLADVKRCDDAGKVAMLQYLKSLAAMSAEQLQDMQQCDQGQHDDSKQLQHFKQQFSGLGPLLTLVHSPATSLEAQLDAANSEIGAEEGHAAGAAAAAVYCQQQINDAQLPLAAVEHFESQGEVLPAVRSQPNQQIQQLLTAGLGSVTSTSKVPARNVGRQSVQSHPLPAVDLSCCDSEVLKAAIAAARAPHSDEGDSCNEQHGEALQQELQHVKQQLIDVQAQLEAAQQDLLRDEEIFAERLMETAKLRDQMAAMAADAEQDRQTAAQQMQCLQTELNRWRTRALGMHSYRAEKFVEGKTEKLMQNSSETAGDSTDVAFMPSRSNFAGEPSLAADAAHRQPQQHTRQLGYSSTAHSMYSSPTIPGAAADPAGVDASANASQLFGFDEHSQAMQAAATTSADLSSGDKQAEADQQRTVAHVLSASLLDSVDLGEEDEVVFDVELASYVSDTDYTDLRAEESHHLLAELQAVLADKVALEEEKATAQAEAAAAHRSFEHSRALLESQLAQMATAISSQEKLIATLENNESQARQAGALYLERCRELETELAKRQLDLEELTAALGQVEADAAASGEEKKRLRTEYERKIQAVVEQMTRLQKQIKGQGTARMERERQRAAQQAQQLQSQVAAMKAEQEALRKRLHDKLLTQERAAAERSKEFAALKRAADAAQKRVVELEMQNRRQRAELQAKDAKVSAAHRQLQQLACWSVDNLGSTACVSPKRHKTTARIHSSSCCSSETRPTKCRSSGVSSCSKLPGQAAPTPAAAGTHVDQRAQAEQLQPEEQQQSTPVVGRSIDSSWPGGSPSTAVPDICPGTAEQLMAVSRASCQASHTVSDDLTSCRGNVTDVVTWHSQDGMSTWSKTYLQLLAVRRTSAEPLQRMHARHIEVTDQRHKLNVVKAQLDLKHLRRVPSSGGSSGNEQGQLVLHSNDSTAQPDEQEDVMCLEDQLDALAAELGHLQQQMQKSSQQASAADTAIAQMRAQVPFMAATELGSLLHQAMDLVSDQGSHWQAAEIKVQKLQLELAQSQQQLEQANSCLHDIKLQQQTQLANLQAECEQHITALLAQITAAATGGHRTQPSCHKAGNQAPACGESFGLQCLRGSLQQNHRSVAGTEATVLHTVCAAAEQQQPLGPMACDNLAMFKQCAGNTDIEVLVDSNPIAPSVSQKPVIEPSSENVQMPSSLCAVRSSLPMHKGVASLSGDEAASFMQPSSSSFQQTTLAQQQLPACSEQTQPMQQCRLSSRQPSPERGPCLSNLEAYSAGQSHKRQQSGIQPHSRDHRGNVPTGQPEEARPAPAIPWQSPSAPGSAIKWCVSHQNDSVTVEPSSPPKPPQTGDAESPLTKLQAKLAAYRHHLQQATAARSTSGVTKRCWSPTVARDRTTCQATVHAASQSTAD